MVGSCYEYCLVRILSYPKKASFTDIGLSTENAAFTGVQRQRCKIGTGPLRERMKYHTSAVCGYPWSYHCGLHWKINQALLN